MIDQSIDLLKNAQQIYPSREKFKKKLEGGLRVYYGIYPTPSNLHIGHSIPLSKLVEFQKKGHVAIILLGDFTASIGDPSGRTTQRKPVGKKEVGKNSQEIVSKIKRYFDFDFNKLEIAHNSTWWDAWGKRTVSEVFTSLSSLTVAQLIERDMFQDRLKKELPISVAEFLYPVLQGYDSVALDADLEIGASDQTFNMLVGRQLTTKLREKEKFVLTLPLLEGPDGRKMSKTYANTIDIDSEPADMFGKVMSVNDTLVEKYFSLLVNESTETKKVSSKKGNELMARKKLLSFKIVEKFHGRAAAEKAEKEFERVYQQGGLPKPVRVGGGEKSIIEILVDSGIVESKSEARRLVEQGAVEINSKVLASPSDDLVLEKGSLIKVGKRRAIEIS